MNEADKKRAEAHLEDCAKDLQSGAMDGQRLAVLAQSIGNMLIHGTDNVGEGMECLALVLATLELSEPSFNLADVMPLAKMWRARMVSKEVMNAEGKKIRAVALVDRDPS